MERLESFVAGALVQRLKRAGRDEQAAACASFRGAVIFVDISGYTALAEALCSQGASGIEQLGTILNQAFGRHVRAVHDNGGEIACFAGDAFIAYWPADDGNVPRALRCANDCARALHATTQAVDAYSPSAPAPALHIGAGAGELWAARLGAGDWWQWLLAGPAVREACAASTRAASGETVIAPAAGPFVAPSSGDLPDSPVAVPRRDEDATTTLGLHDVAQVSRRVQDYMGEGYASWIPQRRTICALFVRIDGPSDSDPDALRRHQDVATSLRSALRPFTISGGTLLLDDKGLVFTLCFGMPHDAHADDALRAVRAGLAIRTELSRIGLTCSVGVTSGAGVCMPLGGPERRQYWSVGRFMHVASRLTGAADHRVLCTEEIADRIRRVASLTPERPLTLKGLRWPLRVFSVGDARTVPDDTEVLYGREEEQTTLDQHLDAVEAGRGAVLWMVGEAGLGKTALVHYLRQATSQRQLKWLAGGAASVDTAVAYGAWRPVFSALLEDPPGTTGSFSEREARLGPIRRRQLAPLVNAVVPGYLDETELVHSLVGQARADATSSVLSEIIASQASTRFVLVLEDCHWMDSASWRLLLRVAQDYPDSLIVLTSRPGADVRELQPLKALERFAELKLGPIRQAALESYVTALLGGEEVTRELIDAIAQRAVGNPLFAREYALLLATQAVQPDNALRAVQPKRTAGNDSVPVTVQSLIAGRLDALAPSEDLALKAASVIGDRFDLDLVASVCLGDLRGDPMPVILGRLIEQQLVLREDAGAQSFAFQHALIREVTYAQLIDEQRRTLHRRAAEALERAHADDLRPYLAALAHHWTNAEVPDCAIKFSSLAASQALAAGAFEEADRLLNACIQQARASSHAVGRPTAIKWYRQIADAHHGMGKLESRSAAAHQVLRLAGRGRAHGTAGLIAQACGRLALMGGRRVFSRHQPPSDPDKMLDVARAYRHSAEVCYFNNDMLGMICDSVSAIECASRVEPSAVLAGASTELGGILSVAGFRRLGERILMHAIAMAEAAHDQAAQAYAHMISCLYYVGMGEWESAERSAKRCQDLCEPMDDRVNWTNAQTVRFWMCHYRSHDAAALDAARNLHDRASETGNRQHRAWALRCLAVCALRRNAPAEAVTHLQAALASLGETAALNERIPTLGFLALAQLRTGEVWSARATAKEGLAQIVRVRRPIGHGTLEGYSALITVALDAWHEEHAPYWKRSVQTCVRVLERYRKGFPVGEPRYQLHRGDYELLQGKSSPARRSYKRGEAAAIRLGMPWDARRCKEAIERL